MQIFIWLSDLINDILFLSLFMMGGNVMNGSYKSVIHVTTFGEFSMEFNGHRISDADDHSKKPWLLLEYLILFRNREISPEELSEAV